MPAVGAEWGGTEPEAQPRRSQLILALILAMNYRSQLILALILAMNCRSQLILALILAMNSLSS